MITSTGYKLPQSVISNTGWENEYRLSFQDGTFAYTTQSDNRLVVGNFLLNIPQDNTIYNIEVTVTGYRNSFPTTLKIWAIDDTSGTEQAYALSPDFNSFTGNSLSYVIGNTLFGRQWTVDEINNIKLALVSDGELYLDNVSLNVTYYDEFPSPSDGDGVGVAPTCEAIMDEYIQAQPFTLAKTLSPEDTYAIVKSFSMPNNVPITISMVGGKLQAVINQGNGSNEENVAIVDIIHNYNGSGLVKLDFGSLTNRGLDFKYPYTAVNQNRKYHIAGSELVLSNSAPFYDRFLIKRDIGCSVSAPIEVEDEGVNIASYLRSLDFKGIPVTATATNNPSGGQDVTVTITGAGGTVPPTITHISTSTTGNSISPVLSWLHESSGVDRLLVVDVSTEQTSSITGVTYNGLPLTLHSTSLNNAGNIRLERWIMTAPTVGIYPIVVNVSPSSYISAGARSFSGVDQTTPFDGAIITLSGNGTSVVSSQTTVTQSSIVLDAIATGFQPIAHNVASGQSVDFTIVNACTRQISGGSQETGSPGVFPTNYSLSAGTNWALLSDGIKGITIASPTAGQNNIQFQDETINLGTTGTVDTVNFTGAGVTATRTGNTVNVTIPGSVGVDEFVKVSATDTTTGYLDNKIELVAGTNTTVTKTILNPGANEKIRYQVNSTGGSGSIVSPGNERFIGDNDILIEFGNFLIAQKIAVLGSQHVAHSIDVNGAYQSIPVPISVYVSPWIGVTPHIQLAVTLSEDKTKLYTTRYYRQSPTGPHALVVDEIDTNLNIINTFSYINLGPATSFVGIGTFIDGNRIIIQFSDTPTAIGNPLFATEFTMSGSLLITPTTTNIVIGTQGAGPSNIYGYGYKHSDGFVYMDYSADPNNTVRKYTYTSPNLSAVLDTTTYQSNINSITPNTCYEGFEITGTNIGWYRNTGTSPNRFLYQIYPF
jgi:hypothetical protein